MIRKNALVLLVVFIVVAGGVYYFAQNKYIERLAEKSGELAFGARVEIDDMHVNLLSLNCGWKRLQIADKNQPMKNLIETGKAEFGLEFLPLFWGKVIISEMTLLNVRHGTARASDGSLPVRANRDSSKSGAFAQTRSALNSRMASLPSLDFSQLTRKINIDSLVNIENLQTVAAYDQLAKNIDSTKSKMLESFARRKYSERITQLKSKIENIKIEKTYDPVKIKNSLNQVLKIKKELDALQLNIQADKNSFTDLTQDAKTRFQSIRKNLQADIDRTKKLARIKELQSGDIGMMLFGARLVTKFEMMMHYLTLARRYLPAAKILFSTEKEPEPERFAGQDISFPFHRRFPNFLIRKIELSGATNADSVRARQISGAIFGLTDQPAIFGKPAEIQLSISRAAIPAVNLRAVLDHVGAIANDSLWVEAPSIKFGEIALQKRPHFPSKISVPRGKFNLSGFFNEDAITLKLQGQASQVKFEYADTSQNIISNTIREGLDGIDNLTLEATLGTTAKETFSVTSNIDEILSRRLKKILGKKTEKARWQLAARVRALADNSRDKAGDVLRQMTEKFEENISQVRREIDQQKQKLAEKETELKKRLAAETAKARKATEKQKNALKKKAKSKLKNLFGKPQKEDSTKSK